MGAGGSLASARPELGGGGEGEVAGCVDCRWERGDDQYATDWRARERTRGHRASAPTQTQYKFRSETSGARTKYGRSSVCVGVLNHGFVPFDPI